MATTRKPILVTGSHRSGTTWVGRMLAMAPRTMYIHEPFNISIGLGVVAKPFSRWFQYICDENAHNYEEALRQVFTYDYPLGANLVKAKTLRDIAAIVKDQGLFLFHRIRGDTPVIKDPIRQNRISGVSKNDSTNFRRNIMIHGHMRHWKWKPHRIVIIVQTGRCQRS
jgi:hypothetical protein